VTDQLIAGQILPLVTDAAGMAGSQPLFKMAALRFAADASLGERLFDLLQKGLVTAVVLYGALSALWVWVLSSAPLSRAYPFAAIAFALTPLLSGLLFAEPLSTRLLIGLAVVACGPFLMAG
jgi:multidrug transporter EmrE-like cation transporter